MKEFRKQYLYLFLIFYLFSANLDSFSQNSDKTVINGTVTDIKTGVPLTGTSVILAKTIVGTITDKDGKYHIETSVKADTILFSFIGYETESRSIIQGCESDNRCKIKIICNCSQ